ncbi:MAG TPA: SAM-dependent DNA methyltransferase [Blastocatellia bacterium]|nr:SAM-dependent DNA methyltransferase [Blastocatellia bacterium]
MSKGTIEYGDFQTPRVLAEAVVALLRDAGVSPSVIVEPTCGLGSFVLAAVDRFRSARQVFAYDVNGDYVSALRERLPGKSDVRFHLAQQDFFKFNWKKFFSDLPGEVLVVGNPPWVTNSALGAIGSDNLPKKTNFQNHSGFGAKTGKANFDISEWMLIKLLESIDGRDGCLAMLCKTATARRVLRHGWINGFSIGRATIHLIDASSHFSASVNACLLIVHTGVPNPFHTAAVYSDLTFDRKVTTFGLVGTELVADVDEYNRVRDLDGVAYYTWRSGVKHDAASIMEFRKKGDALVNGFGEFADLEPVYTFPLLKSSDIANGRLTPQRYVLITQQKPSDDTEAISKIAPKTWSYLLSHAHVLDRRPSIIYRKRPRFSVFGVGDYTFSPWKVAISGLYKNCKFSVIGEYRNQPVVLDDTCYFIPCRSEQEAAFACRLLNSEPARRFLHSLVFFDAKRPVTIDVLNRIDLARVAAKLGLESDAREYFHEAGFFEGGQGLLVFEKPEAYRGKPRGTNRVPRRR